MASREGCPKRKTRPFFNDGPNGHGVFVCSCVMWIRVVRLYTLPNVKICNMKSCHVSDLDSAMDCWPKMGRLNTTTSSFGLEARTRKTDT